MNTIPEKYTTLKMELNQLSQGFPLQVVIWKAPLSQRNGIFLTHISNLMKDIWLMTNIRYVPCQNFEKRAKHSPTSLFTYRGHLYQTLHFQHKQCWENARHAQIHE